MIVYLVSYPLPGDPLVGHPPALLSLVAGIPVGISALAVKLRRGLSGGGCPGGTGGTGGLELGVQ